MGKEFSKNPRKDEFVFQVSIAIVNFLTCEQIHNWKYSNYINFAASPRLSKYLLKIFISIICD